MKVQGLVQPCTTLFTGTGHFGTHLVLQCTALYRLVSRYGIARDFCVENSGKCYILTGKSMYLFILVHTATYQYMEVHTSTYVLILAHTNPYKYILVCTGMYWYVLVHTCTYLDSKKVQTRLEPEIFSILFACSPTALQGYRHQIPGMNHEKCSCTYPIRSVPVRVPGS